MKKEIRELKCLKEKVSKEDMSSINELIKQNFILKSSFSVVLLIIFSTMIYTCTYHYINGDRDIWMYLSLLLFSFCVGIQIKALCNQVKRYNYLTR